MLLDGAVARRRFEHGVVLSGRWRVWRQSSSTGAGQGRMATLGPDSDGKWRRRAR